MTRKTVRRSDITVAEETITSSYASRPKRTWYATLDGKLSTGERVSLSRPGETFKNALYELEQQIIREGWTLENT